MIKCRCKGILEIGNYSKIKGIKHKLIINEDSLCNKTEYNQIITFEYVGNKYKLLCEWDAPFSATMKYKLI